MASPCCYGNADVEKRPCPIHAFQAGITRVPDLFDAYLYFKLKVETIRHWKTWSSCFYVGRLVKKYTCILGTPASESPHGEEFTFQAQLIKKTFFKKSSRIVLYSSQSERTPRVMYLTLVAIRISVCIVKNTDLCKTGHTVEPDCLPCVWYNQFVKVIKRYLCKSINNKHETQESQLTCLWRNRDLNTHHISPKLSRRSTVERCNLFSLWHFPKHHSLLSSLEYFAGVEATRCENVSETQLKQKPWVVLRCYNT